MTPTAPVAGTTAPAHANKVYYITLELYINPANRSELVLPTEEDIAKNRVLLESEKKILAGAKGDPGDPENGIPATAPVSPETITTLENNVFHLSMQIARDERIRAKALGAGKITVRAYPVNEIGYEQYQQIERKATTRDAKQVVFRDNEQIKDELLRAGLEGNYTDEERAAIKPSVSKVLRERIAEASFPSADDLDFFDLP